MFNTIFIQYEGKCQETEKKFIKNIQNVFLICEYFLKLVVQ